MSIVLVTNLVTAFSAGERAYKYNIQILYGQLVFLSKRKMLKPLRKWPSKSAENARSANNSRVRALRSSASLTKGDLFSGLQLCRRLLGRLGVIADRHVHGERLGDTCASLGSPGKKTT